MSMVDMLKYMLLVADSCAEVEGNAQTHSKTDLS